MTDDIEDEPAVELGTQTPVEGAPLARVSARLMWGIEKSEIESREGDTVIRTPDGPRKLEEVLDDVETTYFDTRQTFDSAVRDVIGTGPVPTAGGDDEQANAEADDGDETDAEEWEPISEGDGDDPDSDTGEAIEEDGDEADDETDTE